MWMRARLIFKFDEMNMRDGGPVDETFSEEETEARREATLKQMLATPHKPHTASKGKRGKSSQSK